MTPLEGAKHLLEPCCFYNSRCLMCQWNLQRSAIMPLDYHRAMPDDINLLFLLEPQVWYNSRTLEVATHE